MHWIWPADRCANCQSIYTISLPNDSYTKNLDHIHRSSDGRFVLSDDSGIEVRPHSLASTNSSESDDGGFLQPRGGRGRTSWRKPLVSNPSELSFRSDLPKRSIRSATITPHTDTRDTPDHFQLVTPVQYQNLQINTTHALVHGIISPAMYTPSRVSRIVSSSPAMSSPMGITSPWSPQTMYFSDLSSVQQPSSAERSFPTPRSNISQLRYLQERYSQELPSLRAIHEETKRMAQGFVPLQIQLQSPSWRFIQPLTVMHQPMVHQTPSNHHVLVHQQNPNPNKTKAKLMPRYARMARSAPDLSPQLNTAMRVTEVSPESRSSSSGFGSKNTSTQQNQSSQSGSTNTKEWRTLPPYRPPPPPKYYPYHPPPISITGQPFHDAPPYNMGQWLELIKLNAAAPDQVNSPTKAVDVGSVDGHYEFDPATPTPTASTPTGPRDEHQFVVDHQLPSTSLMHTQSLLPFQRKRASKNDNIEARVQAMKEEFNAYRKRQATRQIAAELESAC